MPKLHEPDKAEDDFELTPEYNQLLVEYELENPNHPDPRFDAHEQHAFKFYWPGTAPKPAPLEARRQAAIAQRRKANGQFAITARND